MLKSALRSTGTLAISIALLIPLNACGTSTASSERPAPTASVQDEASPSAPSAPTPAASAAAQAPSSPSTVTQTAPGSKNVAKGTAGGTILVVSAQSTWRRMLFAAMQSVGYRVDMAEDGSDALKKVEGYPLVITDERMPNMGGLEFVKTARERGITAPILMVASPVGPDLMAAATAAGVTRVMQKSMPMSVIVDWVKSNGTAP